ncbi:bifunctional 4-hydroxy-2-oxoglutarate aldolase/2-dehydro-3-deoxy-phosphogluconate aldolase [Fodinisporobacter ferrooxydans]|uniref:Bifunctional 4-hydroxy-2-oxoglutarate aldolase/2-dehydro-3-deoxy-phosphogluconate aldolase n=1 Tax=Fodinisporobacter ferrooxydans TaxID=2901836 RepID=A0ABY4CML0_9BACL|nr:bifunctional 4-hydroxy-2-oxoglutarate aldolase/2-dehydro-3-deoxy-phosphogluconate aldolase [Alicyclobacillaceae bacterium MYW30-H2]
MLPKVKLLQKMVESGVIAVIRRMPADKIDQIAKSLVEGGVTALEVTIDSPLAFEIIHRLSKRFENHAVVGAGTVIDCESAYMAIHNGADFVFCPSLHEGVIRTTLRYGKVVVPGVMTPTEMITAVEWGADLVKVFPAGGLGVKYIKDIKAPFSHIPIIPTGGVNLENVDSFIEAGVAAVGIGGKLIDSQAVKDSNFDKITKTAIQFVNAVQAARLRIWHDCNL